MSFSQGAKKLILEDMLKEGTKAGLNGFEQVRSSKLGIVLIKDRLDFELGVTRYIASPRFITMIFI